MDLRTRAQEEDTLSDEERSKREMQALEGQAPISARHDSRPARSHRPHRQSGRRRARRPRLRLRRRQRAADAARRCELLSVHHAGPARPRLHRRADSRHSGRQPDARVPRGAKPSRPSIGRSRSPVSRKGSPRCLIALNTIGFAWRRPIRRRFAARRRSASSRSSPTSSGGRLKVEKFAESLEGRPIYLATLGTGPRARAAVVADARRRADAHGRAARPVQLSAAAAGQAARGGHSGGCTLMFIPMLNPDGAEAVIAVQRSGHRHQPRLAPPGDAGRTRAAAGRENAEAAVRVQPAQSKRPHDRRPPAAAGRRFGAGAAARRDSQGIAVDADRPSRCARASSKPCGRSPRE